MPDDSSTEHPGAIGDAKRQLHGVFVRVFDTGVLLLGESGVGKSECALELITRGHRLIADDAVEIFIVDEMPFGKAPSLIRNLLEIRGLGIINVSEVFGERSVCEESSIELCIELKGSSDGDPLRDARWEYVLAGSRLPKFVLPVSTAPNLATLIETAVRLHLTGGTVKTSELLNGAHATLLQPSR